MTRNNYSRDDQHYQRPSAYDAKSNSRWIVYCVMGAAAIIVLAVVIGIVINIAKPSQEDLAGGDPQLSTAAADVNGGSVSTSQSSNTSSNGSDASALANRDSEFAVDPNRTDWNYNSNGRKTVYLTIDDGPSALTSHVLDILDRYNCKATFFVVGHNQDSFPMIAEAYKRGHTIGLHTYSHDYAEVYSSVDAYFADLEAIGQVVKEQIGYVPCFIRFPGGSSNGISANYSAGIMTELTQLVQQRGYQYYDWNLSVGDGSEHTTEEIVGYGTTSPGEENIMLLCHDSALKQTTVDALPSIIEFYQAQGYTFEALDRNSWVCHHGVNN